MSVGMRDECWDVDGSVPVCLVRWVLFFAQQLASQPAVSQTTNQPDAADASRLFLAVLTYSRGVLSAHTAMLTASSDELIESTEPPRPPVHRFPTPQTEATTTTTHVISHALPTLHVADDARTTARARCVLVVRATRELGHHPDSACLIRLLRCTAMVSFSQ